MEVSFYSIDNENNRISYKSEAKIENGFIVFEDKSLDSTNVYIKKENDSLTILRAGKINMEIKLIPDTLTTGAYQNDIGVEFEFNTFCKKLLLSEKRYDAEYDIILDKDIISSHKIWIILR